MSNMASIRNPIAYRDWYNNPTQSRRWWPQRWAEGVGLFAGCVTKQEIVVPYFLSTFAKDMPGNGLDRGQCNPSMKRLARGARMRVTRLRDVLQRLEAGGWLSVERSKGGRYGGTHVFTLTLPTPALLDGSKSETWSTDPREIAEATKGPW